MSDYKIDRPLGRIVDIQPQLEARRDAREERQLCEISDLHRAIGSMRACCQEALKHCMHPNSIQAQNLKWAIEYADGTLR